MIEGKRNDSDKRYGLTQVFENWTNRTGQL